MKKKIFLGLSIFVTLFSLALFSPQKTFAQTCGACRESSSVQCGRGEIVCNLINGTHCCCGQLAGGNSCSQVPGSSQQKISPGGEEYKTDPTIGCDSGSINTAIGWVGFQNTDNFVGTIFKWAVGIGGGISFLLIIFAGFLIMTSAANPERLKEGKELMTSAISGIILLILSIFVLRVIVVDILKLPGFGSQTVVPGGAAGFKK